jgi:competence protein ComFC
VVWRPVIGLLVVAMSVCSSIINAIFPPLCVHCGREGAWLCSTSQDILRAERVIVNPITITGINSVLVRGSYDCEPLAQLIQKLKYHYWTGLAGVLDEVVTPLMKALDISKETVIIPVPLHSRRHRERGFNQSLIIGKALSKATGMPLVNLLQRTRYTTPQATLSAKERTTNIVGAFGRERVAKWPKSGILVDDVITTGSTIAECASVLRQHGVQQITAVALAKG